MTRYCPNCGGKDGGIMRRAFAILAIVMALTGCSQASRVNQNIREEADNFGVRRRVVAINTRTNESLFAVEGLISLKTDGDGDLNVTIKTGPDEYKLFYAHLSDSVTYTAIQLDASDVSPYAYEIAFFPPVEMLEHGLIDVQSTEEITKEAE